jgi:hypothetical protein
MAQLMAAALGAPHSVSPQLGAPPRPHLSSRQQSVSAVSAWQPLRSAQASSSRYTQDAQPMPPPQRGVASASRYALWQSPTSGLPARATTRARVLALQLGKVCGGSDSRDCAPLRTPRPSPASCRELGSGFQVSGPALPPSAAGEPSPSPSPPQATSRQSAAAQRLPQGVATARPSRPAPRRGLSLERRRGFRRAPSPRRAVARRAPRACRTA